MDYEYYIEDKFGDPVIDCPIYNDVVTTDTERCPSRDKGYCYRCRKYSNDVDYAAWLKRQAEFEKWLEEQKL